MPYSNTIIPLGPKAVTNSVSCIPGALSIPSNRNLVLLKNLKDF